MIPRWCLLLCLGMLPWSLGACAARLYETRYDRAVVLQDRGVFPEALELYKEILAEAPRHLRARFNLASIYHEQKRYEEAAAQYTLLLKAYPHHARSLVNLADIAMAEGQPGRAYVLLLQAVAVEPDRGYPYSFLGRYFYEQGKLTEAREALERSLAIEDDALTYYRLGLLSLRQGRDAEALAQFSRAVALNPRDARALYQLALLALQHQQYDEATRALQRLTVLTPRDAEIFFLLGKIALQQQQYATAALHFWEVRDLQASTPEVEQLLLQAYEGLLRQQRAIIGLQ